MELLKQLLADEAPAWTEDSHAKLWAIFTRVHGEYLARLAVKLRVPRHLIEDLVQSVWVKILARWDSFRKPDGARRLLALSRKMLHDMAVDTMRRRDQRRATELDTATTELFADGMRDPLELAIGKEIGESVRAGLQKLREKDAWLLSEHYLKERPIKELAEEKGLTEKAIRCRMTRAVKALRRILCPPRRNRRGRERER